MSKVIKGLQITLGVAALASAVMALAAVISPAEQLTVSTVVKAHLHYNQLEKDDEVGTVVLAPEQWYLVTREGYICEVGQWSYNSIDDGSEVNVEVMQSPYANEMVCLSIR